MRIVERIAEVREFVREQRQAGRSVGLVPTMGYLHEGHLRLMREARATCGAVVASIFVNPLQFGPQEDYGRYPRDLQRDAALAAGAGVDVLFVPSLGEMYPRPTLAFVGVEKLTEGLCGGSRPGHFRGVATVVSKLFNIVQPDYAFFGQKDAQQAAVIRRMAEDLDFPVTVVTVPIVREPDGLAMSSRNAYLSPAEREAALVLYRSLRLAGELVAGGERRAAAVAGEMRKLIEAEPLARIDYVSIVQADTLEPLETVAGRALVALAVYVGKTRLIDNLVLEA